ncbi:DUF4222 domain-containing protein [Klebsiella aerogenes]|uniref:DUF4222 domain-containing protein n=1 Tax=Klebsiella aerogenes TaxID=548 RepID=UPI0034D2510F
MCNLQERMRRVLQRNTMTGIPSDRAARSRRYKDRRGRMVTVLEFGAKTVLYRRDGYDQNSELSRDKFFRDFVEVQP